MIYGILFIFNTNLTFTKIKSKYYTQFPIHMRGIGIQQEFIYIIPNARHTNTVSPTPKDYEAHNKFLYPKLTEKNIFKTSKIYYSMDVFEKAICNIHINKNPKIDMIIGHLGVSLGYHHIGNMTNEKIKILESMVPKMNKQSKQSNKEAKKEAKNTMYHHIQNKDYIQDRDGLQLLCDTKFFESHDYIGYVQVFVSYRFLLRDLIDWAISNGELLYILNNIAIDIKIHGELFFDIINILFKILSVLFNLPKLTNINAIAKSDEDTKGRKSSFKTAGISVSMEYML